MTKNVKEFAEGQIFQETWTLDYFFIEHSGNSIWLICLESIILNEIESIW